MSDRIETNETDEEQERIDLKDWLLDVRARNNGVLTPKIVMEAAKPIDSPAHHWVFGLNQEQAAEAYYIEQAHKLIRYVRVKRVIREDEPPRLVRFFHAVPSDKPAFVYETIDDIRAAPPKFERVRDQADRRLKEAQEAVEELDALAPDQPTKDRTRQAAKAVREARQLVTIDD